MIWMDNMPVIIVLDMDGQYEDRGLEFVQLGD